MYSFVNGYLWDHQALNSTLVVIYNIVGFIVPLFTQLSCLIFVYIRSRRESKLPKTTSLVKNQTDHYVEKSEQRRPDYISVFDPTVEYYMVDATKYLQKSG